ncbi:glycoside hydrolase family 2 TIM barrel-domain containing protein [Pontiella desulfatans]|nr:glycoside hydrolase family 2 TIM barrel-domain containing protein [Pontiella desulfatans]
MAMLFAVMASAETKPEWADREVFEINRLPAHAFTHRFPNKEAARPEPDWETPYHPDRYKMLNGMWKFKWSENPASAPKDFYEANYSVKSWDEIPVPLPWQIAGYGQLYYFASGMPMISEPRNGVAGTLTGDDLDLFNNRPGPVYSAKATEGWVPTKFNPVGCYVTDFTVPKNWAKERVVLHFGGVKSAFYCWLNGEFVGYSQDSFTPAEFDITSLLKKGENRLAVKVIRWSDGTYMENQDMIRMSGIFRDVYIVQTPKTYIENFFLVPELSDDLATGMVKLDVDLDGSSEPRTVEFELFNNQTGKRVLNQTAKSREGKVRFTAEINNPDRWHVEQANLYTAFITLKKGNKVEEVLRQDVGFRKLTWDEFGNMYLNGARYMIRGVNAHDTSEHTGRTLSYEEMVKDVTTMRALNINSLRMAHYPKDIRYYALCNRYGIAVADENNMESHTFDRIYADPKVEPLYRPQALFRMNNMVQRDKNMPSIIMWSYGNEQFPKHLEEIPTLTALCAATKKTDPTRPGFAERTFHKHTDNNIHLDDIEFIAPMYSGFKNYAKWNKSGQDRRPFLMCEYAHAMGNSVPNLKREWDFFEAHRGMNGGYIWDFVDQSVLMEVEGQEGKHWTYGGDWGAFDSSRQFCNNGVVLPDRSLNGKSYEVRAVYQQVQFDASGKPGVVKVKNKFALRNLSDFDFRWTLLENGRAVESGSVNFDLDPLSETEFKAPITLSLKKGARYDINFDVSLKADEVRGVKGDFVAAGQISLQAKAEVEASVSMPKGTPKTRTQGDRLIVDIDNGQVVFNQKTGLLEQLVVKGEKLLVPESDLQGIEFNPNMCLVDDMAVFNKPQKVKDDIAAGLLRMKRSNGSVVIVDSPEGSVRVKTVCDYLVDDLKRGLRHTSTYTILSDGTIRVDNDISKLGLPADSLQLRIGARLPVIKELDHVEYAALGPYENYDMRKTSVRFGHFESDAASMMGHYVRPQECGNRSGLEWISMQNAQGLGLVIVSDSTGHGSVMPNTAEEMDAHRHQTALPEKDRWILRYDEKLSVMRKAPNISFSEPFEFGYTIRLLNGAENPEAAASRGLPAQTK